VEITSGPTTGDIGDTNLQFIAVARDAQGNICGAVTINWMSEDPTIALINPSGLIATLDYSGDPGDYDALIDITATADGTAISDTLELTVTNPVDHVVVTPDPASMTTCVDPPLQFTAVAKDSSNFDVVPPPPIFWSSSNTPTATIGGTGLATAKAAGVTQITATAYGVTSPDVPLTVSGGASIVVDILPIPPPPITVVAGSGQAFTATVSGFAVDDSVTWSVDGGSANGTVNPTNPSGPTNPTTYTAPASVPIPSTVTVRATSDENPACSGTADVTIAPTFTLAPASPFALGGGQNPQALVIGQFSLSTPDANLDVAVANQGTNTVSTLLGDGLGGLGAPSSVSTSGSDPVALAQGFFNADANPDLAAVNFADSPGTVASLLGTGTGSFTPATEATHDVGDSPQSVSAGDLDNDGFDDLAVANFFSEDVSILTSDGDGTFTTSQTISSLGTGPWSVAIGFIDGDGDRDLAVTDLSDNTVWILLGNGDGTFPTIPPGISSIALPVSAGPIAVAIADLDDDGFFNPDLAIVNVGIVDNDCSPPPIQPANANKVTILMGDGLGGFGAPVMYAVGASPRAIATGDFDQDGAIDLVTANYCSDTVSILFGENDGTFQSAASYSTDAPGSDRPTGVAVGDLDNDANPDVAVTNSGTDTVSVLLNNN
jgi:hypothetical protein